MRRCPLIVGTSRNGELNASTGQSHAQWVTVIVLTDNRAFRSSMGSFRLPEAAADNGLQAFFPEGELSVGYRWSLSLSAKGLEPAPNRYWSWYTGGAAHSMVLSSRGSRECHRTSADYPHGGAYIWAGASAAAHARESHPLERRSVCTRTCFASYLAVRFTARYSSKPRF